MMILNTIENIDCIQGLRKLPDGSVDCCVTSPPYFGLRDYGHEGQIGLEETPEAFVSKMVEVFTEVKRVLKNEGTLWLNLGDSYCSGKTGQASFGDATSGLNNGGKNTKTGEKQKVEQRKLATGLKPKDLIGIPWTVAFALRQPFFTCNNCQKKTHSTQWGRFPNGRYICPLCVLSKGHSIEPGWYLRQDIIWHKPNPMPESVTDRCTKAHEYIFLLSKSRQYYYDHESIKEPLVKASHQRLAQDLANQKGSNRVPGKTNGPMKAVGNKGLTFGGKKGREYMPGPDDPNFRNGSEQWGREYVPSEDGKANKRSVWTVTTKPFSEAHFATFPEDLIVDCIKAGCPENGIVLDPFMGAGTTALVAQKLQRNFIGFELNADYIKISDKRLRGELGLFHPHHQNNQP
jgi:DNA modification methylase